jgi:acyl-CoA thioesterase-1
MRRLALALALAGAFASPAGAKEGCATPAALVRLDGALPRIEAKLKVHQPITILALGSSSTAGYGASSPANSYPSRLAAELAARLPQDSVEVRNKGVGGDTTYDMLKRFDADVLSQHPDLVIWQLGTNAVLLDMDLPPHEVLIRDGLERLKAAGIDALVMDLQYSPKVLSHPHFEEMEDLLAEIGHEEKVPVFRRFAIMRHWLQSGQLSFRKMLSRDGLHMNDLSYDCLARLLAEAIVDRLSTGAVASGR